MLTTVSNNPLGQPHTPETTTRVPEHWDLYLEIDRICNKRQSLLDKHLECLGIYHFLPQSPAEAVKFSIVTLFIIITLFTHWEYTTLVAIGNALVELFAYIGSISSL